MAHALSWRGLMGAALVAAGLIGFITVADDLRHTGELFGVAGILGAGVALVVSELKPKLLRRVALPWLAAGILAGAAGGAAAGKMLLGTSLGVVAGAALAVWLGGRRTPDGSTACRTVTASRKERC